MLAYILPSMLKPVRRPLGIFAAVAMALGLLAGGLTGQSVWTNPDGGSSLELEVLRPHFSDPDVRFTGATGAVFLTGRLALARGWTIVADLPFSRAAWEVGTGSSSSTLFGNPYVGAEWRPVKGLTAELGVRLPSGDLDDLEQLAAVLVGVAGEVDRMEAFVPETMGIHAAASWQAPLGEGLTFRVRGAPTFLTGEGGPDDLLLAYTGQLWYARHEARVGVGLTGRANLTTDDQDADRTVHQVVAVGDYRFGPLRPGIQVRVPLDKDLRQITGYTVGVSMGYSFR